MALSKGAKIALGCGLAAVLAAGAAVIVVGGLAWWGIGKAKEATEGVMAEQEAAEKDLQKANANPFTAPEDGVVQEDRLVKYLAVRKRIHDEVYLKHKAMIETQAQKETADLSALAKLPLIMAELRASKARGLADQGMSEAEFSWLSGTVYSNMILDGVARSGDGTSVAEANRVSVRAAAEAAEQAARAAEANPSVPAESKQQLREAADQARAQADQAVEMTRALEVPPANRALFDKHRGEILKYTMGGLELLSF
jgi:hypothetical protein